MMSEHYRDRFLNAAMGGKIVGLYRQVHAAGVRVTVDGRPIDPRHVKELTDGQYILFENDLKIFAESVRALGGYDDNPNLEAIFSFLGDNAPSETPSAREIAETDNETPVSMPPQEIVVKPRIAARPPQEHPTAPGWFLQPDGCYWRQGVSKRA